MPRNCSVYPAACGVSNADISLPHPVVLEQRLARPGHHDPAVLQHITAIGEAERDRDVLLDQDDGESRLPR